MIIRTEPDYDSLGRPGYLGADGFERVNLRLPKGDRAAWLGAVAKCNAKRPAWRKLTLSAWLRAWAALGVQHSAGAVYVQPSTAPARRRGATKHKAKKGGGR